MPLTNTGSGGGFDPVYRLLDLSSLKWRDARHRGVPYRTGPVLYVRVCTSGAVLRTDEESYFRFHRSITNPDAK